MSAPTKRVPREPTPEMIQIGDDVMGIEQLWRSMYDAAPDADTGRVAELVRQQDVYLRRAVELEHRIERALAVMDGSDGRNLDIHEMLDEGVAILRGDADG